MIKRNSVKIAAQATNMKAVAIHTWYAWGGVKS